LKNKFSIWWIFTKKIC